MDDARALYEIFHHQLPENVRVTVLQEINLPDDRPSVLRGRGGLIDDAVEWINRHRTALVPVVLRHIDPSDDLIAQLTREGDIQVPSEQLSSQTVCFSGFPQPSDELRDASNGFALTDVTASSLLLFQLFLDLSAANAACGIQLPLARINLNHGSVELPLVGGGLFASGVGLIVACGAGLIGAPVISVLGGVTLATAGVIDLVVGWRKSVAEVHKTNVEAGKLDAERRLADVDIKIKELELERARLAATVPVRNELGRIEPRERRERLLSPPESGEVAREIVQRQAEELGMTEGYATHLLNRALPGMRIL